MQIHKLTTSLFSFCRGNTYLVYWSNINFIIQHMPPECQETLVNCFMGHTEALLSHRSFGKNDFKYAPR